MKIRSIVVLFIFLGLFFSLRNIAHKWESYSFNIERSSDKGISLSIRHSPEIQCGKQQEKEEGKKCCAKQRGADAHPKKVRRIYEWFSSRLEKDHPAPSSVSFTIKLDV